MRRRPVRRLVRQILGASPWVAVVVGLVVALLGHSVVEARADTVQSLAAYAPERQDAESPTHDNAPERGPIAKSVERVATLAVRHDSQGTSARPDVAAIHPYTTYAASASLAHINHGAAVARRPAGSIDEEHLGLSATGVAAKSESWLGGRLAMRNEAGMVNFSGKDLGAGLKKNNIVRAGPAYEGGPFRVSLGAQQKYWAKLPAWRRVLQPMHVHMERARGGVTFTPAAAVGDCGATGSEDRRGDGGAYRAGASGEGPDGRTWHAG